MHTYSADHAKFHTTITEYARALEPHRPADRPADEFTYLTVTEREDRVTYVLTDMATMSRETITVGEYHPELAAYMGVSLHGLADPLEADHRVARLELLATEYAADLDWVREQTAKYPPNLSSK